MSLRLQHRDGEQRTWMRWIAVLCMLLIMVASTVELTHTHPDVAKPLQKQGQTAPTDHCPLCVAMHSALPTALQAAPEPVMMVGAVQGPAIDTRRRLLWAHGLASRPPPAHTLIAL